MSFYNSKQGEESNSSANKCMLKVAQYAAQLENYDRAIEIYEQVRLFQIHNIMHWDISSLPSEITYICIFYDMIYQQLGVWNVCINRSVTKNSWHYQRGFHHTTTLEFSPIIKHEKQK